MQEVQSSQNFSNIQLELLKLYSTDIENSELLEIKNYLANFFAKKAISEADSIWESENFDNELMDKWLDEN